jgi:DNA-directed RNA polymerase specialized sigma24 family protein
MKALEELTTIAEQVFEVLVERHQSRIRAVGFRMTQTGGFQHNDAADDYVR